jgi:alkanesulfonate monooxygenase SsuD/methylene tetrahydromethanopterin reductase-like flavin-dependent oxidoreductase (luciferase family)
MNTPTFGWVITPAARDASGASTLHENNRRFIEHIRSVFDTIWVEDHFQWSDRPVVECWTALTYLAAQYPEFRFGALVLGQSYRNPALTAKMMATLHWLTGGRTIAGIGAGWKDDEYHAYNWPYPEPRTRVEQLEDAVNIIRAMWTQSPATYTGKHYSIKDAYCEPRPNPPPPLLIAGGGERLTLRVVAKHADWMNVGFRDAKAYARKLNALRGHCEKVGRDYDSIKKTYFGFVSVTRDGAKPEPRGDLHIVYGRPDQVAKELKEFVELGVEHFMLRFVDFPSTDGLEMFLSEVAPVLTRA